MAREGLARSLTAIGLLLGTGALAGLAGALYARMGPARPGLLLVMGAWAVGMSVAAGLAARRVAPAWHPPLAAAALLVGLGLLMQYRLAPVWALRQVGVWLLAVALTGAVWLARGGPWAQGRGWEALLALSTLGVLLTLRWGVHPAGLGGRLWLPVGPWLVPPGEGLKAAWVGVAASRARPGQGLDARGWAWAVALGALLILQGDWGSAALVLLVALTVHAAQANRARVWLLAGALAVFVTPLLVQHVPRVAQRWRAWLWPHHAPLGYGYQPLAAEAALARGGWWGTGLAAGHPEQVPLSATDFIFVAWGEEGGWIALAVLVGLEAVVWFTLGCLACRLEPGWPRALGMGVTAYGAWLAGWVMAGNLRLVPLSGLPLPWVAHGGAALLALTWLVAVVTARPGPGRFGSPCPRVWRGTLLAWAILYAAVLARAAWLAHG